MFKKDDALKEVIRRAWNAVWKRLVALAHGNTIEKRGISVHEKIIKAKVETGDDIKELQAQKKEKARQVIMKTDRQELKLRSLNWYFGLCTREN